MENKLRKLFSKLGATVLSMQVNKYPDGRYLAYVHYSIKGRELSHDHLGTEKQLIERFSITINANKRIINQKTHA